MGGHLRAFSFVDQIARVEPVGRIQGHYAIPAGVDSFPASLVVEAVGQLAAWAAMAAVGFSHRPVAGIAGSIELLSAVRPGQNLDLAAELESVDELLRRIEQASKYVPMENLAVSTQCGFASAASGNLISWDDMRRKLELVAEVARTVWG